MQSPRSLVLALTTLALGGCFADVGGAGPEQPYSTTANGYATQSIVGNPTSTPAHLQADLNIKLRGLLEVNEIRQLVQLNGPTDGGAPKVNTLFVDHRTPGIARVFKVGVFGGLAQGTESGAVHVLEFVSQGGEELRTPASGYDIGDGKTALVLYADDDSLTLKYTREDNIVHGYAIHLLGLQVEPALRNLYDSCVAAGRQQLPALAAGQRLGTANGTLRVSVRDTGQFMDPRSRKDWYDGTGPEEPPPSEPPPSSPSEPPPSSPPEEPPPTSPPPEPPPSSPPPAGGTSCSASGVSFALSQAPAACGQVSIAVTAASPFTWVMAGVQAPGSTVTWQGGATNVGCSGGACHWTFPGVGVPCQAGPYTVHLIKDATGDNPAAGVTVASCQL
jgi:hypothetical protein